MGLSAISQAEAWGDPKRPRFGMAYLLLAPAQEVEDKRRFGLVAVWVHQCQAHLPLVEEAVRKLTLLINTREDWPYAFVHLWKDSQYIPLSSYGHISIMIGGTPRRSACGCLSQLEVHQLLQSDTQVVYPEGLNGCLVPVVTSLLGSLAHSANALNDEAALLQVDLSQFKGEYKSKAPIPSKTSTSTSPAHLTMAHPAKWTATSAWPMRSVSFHHGQLWTPPAKHWGIPPQKDQYLQPLRLHSFPDQKIPPSQ